MKCYKYAIRGISTTLKNERNMRIHLCVAFYVVLGGIVTELDGAGFTAVLICIGLVIALECINTSIENFCDALHPEKNAGIGRAKDAAAGAVLCVAVVAAVVGGLVFFREARITAALEFFKNQKLLSGLIILSLIPTLAFVMGRKRKTK